MAKFLYNYRSTLHSGLKTISAEVLFKCKFKTLLDIIKPKFEKGEEKYKYDNIDKFKDYNSKSFIYKVKVFDTGYFVLKRHSSQLLERSLPINDCNVEDKISYPLESASVMLDLPISNGGSNNNNRYQLSQNQPSELPILRRSSRMSRPPDRLNL